VILLATLLSGCGAATNSLESALLGRWERVGEPSIGDPLSSLGKHIEFRENGLLVVLLRDECLKCSQAIWTVGTAEYSPIGQNRIQVTGKCWQGWESHSCTQTYRLVVAGDNLTIYDEITGVQDEYERIGEVEESLPPTLAPPFPSATPTRDAANASPPPH